MYAREDKRPRNNKMAARKTMLKRSFCQKSSYKEKSSNFLSKTAKNLTIR